MILWSLVEQAFLLEQRLTELNHLDPTLITYPNLGHEFSLSSEWFNEHGLLEKYVLQDIFEWLSDPLRNSKIIIIQFIIYFSNKV